MKIKIKRIDKTLPFPAYKTSAAAAFDLSARITVTILPNEVKLIPLNVVIELPKNTWALLASRSSTHKKGIMAANGIGIIDSDYCGENDEYHFAALNFTNEAVTIDRGARIAQLIICNLTKAEFEEVDSLAHNRDRGGFGSTGTY